MSYEPIPRWKRLLGGLLLMALSGSGWIWVWQDALDTGSFNLKTSLMFPSLFVVSIAVILLPNYKDERIARGEDISELSGTQLITFRWWIVTAVALAAGFGNLLAVKLL